MAKLILMRHGESIWNKHNVFTGWVDIPLSQQGIAESIDGGKKIRELPIHVIFTSSLIRAQMSCALAMLHHSSGKIPVFHHPGIETQKEWGKIYGHEARQETVPVYVAWELNERMYGKLQGLNKTETMKQFGEAQVHAWRRSYNTVPPEGESLAMTVARAIPYFKKKVIPYLEKEENVFICAHGNSLRGIVMHIEDLSPEEIVKREIATGEPFMYSYEEGQWSKQ
ncbi:MAG TPA: 2,3-bisphosphoglycerate-dependent phosphoglycerate mutase [Chlamydiales bacterium]|nr:2,3-bisphosphoglycerate-dependent phosphoglycerate mutase [Chlamydiales bacterium]